MPNYRRLWVPGGTFFFTVNLLERRHKRLLVEHIDGLRASFRDARRAKSFDVIAIAVMPSICTACGVYLKATPTTHPVGRVSNPVSRVDFRLANAVPMCASENGSVASGSVDSGST